MIELKPMQFIPLATGANFAVVAAGISAAVYLYADYFFLSAAALFTIAGSGLLMVWMKAKLDGK